jgi:hypothetical protein
LTGLSQPSWSSVLVRSMYLAASLSFDSPNPNPRARTSQVAPLWMDGPRLCRLPCVHDVDGNSFVSLTMERVNERHWEWQRPGRSGFMVWVGFGMEREGTSGDVPGSSSVCSSQAEQTDHLFHHHHHRRHGPVSSTIFFSPSFLFLTFPLLHLLFCNPV